jgi:hypothetical protein
MERIFFKKSDLSKPILVIVITLQARANFSEHH